MKDITLTNVETRSSRIMRLRVDYQGKPVGFLEKFRDTSGIRNPWKSFLGIGYNSKYLGVCYPKLLGGAVTQSAFKAAQELAASVVVAAHLGLDYNHSDFQKA